MKVNRTLRNYAKQHNLRLVSLAFQTQRGGTIEFEGCVTTEDAGRVGEMLRELNDLSASFAIYHKAEAENGECA